MTTRRVILLGGTGFVGRLFVQSWRQERDGELCLLLHRSTPEWTSHCGAKLREVDLSQPASVETALDGGGVLINLLRPDGSGWATTVLDNLLPRLEPAGVRHLVHASSIDVYGRSPARLIDEDSSLQPRTPYEREHHGLEGLVRDGTTAATILRLGAVFGIGSQNLLALARETAEGPSWKLALRRSLSGYRRMHLVAVENVVAALRLCVTTPTVLGRTLLVTDDAAESNNLIDVQARLAQAFGRSVPRAPLLPAVFLRTMLGLRGRSCTDPFRRFSDGRLADVGYRPAIDFDAALTAYCNNISREISLEAL
ncbi:MAG: NAD-dependent epimerase/dehydratase family protein [Kiloniellales bacterium]